MIIMMIMITITYIDDFDYGHVGYGNNHNDYENEYDVAGDPGLV